MAENTVTLKDFYGRPYGFIRTDSNGVQRLFDFFWKPLGSYDPKQNITRDFFGTPIGSGNLLTMLLDKHD